MSRSIARLSHASSSLIRCSQVIPDLFSAVKELIENSIDAGALFVDVLVEEFGTGNIVVIDNGSGMDVSELEGLATLYQTSKLSTFEECETVRSFGFRGEALASLCALCKEVEVTSKKEGIERTCMYANGKLSSTKVSQNITHTSGTNVTLLGLFDALPVRRKHFVTSCKREFSTALHKWRQYCFLCLLKDHITSQPGCRVRLLHNNAVVGSSQLGQPVIQGIASVFGSKIARSLTTVSWSFEQDSGLDSEEMSKVPTCITVQGALGLVASASSALHYLFVNGRPVDIPRIHKALLASRIDPTASTLARKSQTLSVAYILNMNMEDSGRSVDYNVTPDKRTVILHDEAVLADLLHRHAAAHFQEQRSTEKRQYSMCTPTVSAVGQEITTPIQKKVNSSLAYRTRDSSSSNDRTGKKNELDVTPLFTPGPLEYTPTVWEKSNTSNYNQDRTMDNQNTVTPPVNIIDISTKIVDHEQEEANIVDPEIRLDFSQSSSDSNLSGDENSAPLEEYSWTVSTAECILFADSNDRRVMPRNWSVTPENVVGQDAPRLLDRTDFLRMFVLGQFNLGFILTSLDGQLFIIDQHAADEKHNYESLVLDAKRQVRKQRLLVPYELSSALSPRHIEIREILRQLENHGIELHWKDVECVEADDYVVSSACQVLCVPTTIGITYSLYDVEDVITQLLNTPESSRHQFNSTEFLPQSKRNLESNNNSKIKSSCVDTDIGTDSNILLSTRVYDMLASRACRKSIMIGDPLDFLTMRNVVSRLGSLQNPWECPHGRPTIRRVAVTK